MHIQKVCALYFSPTGTTKSVLQFMLKEFTLPQEEVDLTPYENRDNTASFSEHDLVMIGIPVYGGRVPITAENRIKLLKGNNTPIVLVATYGNIHYSNALFELQNIVTANGFITIGATIVVSEHNVVSGIASGRPNAQDLSAILSFIKQLQAKMLHSKSLKSIALKGKMPKALRGKQPIKPHGNKKCTYCGVCGKLCPVQVIDDPRKIAGQACIRCMRCIKYCPQKARTYGKLMKVAGKIFLSLVSHSEEKRSEFFL